MNLFMNELRYSLVSRRPQSFRHRRPGFEPGPPDIQSLALAMEPCIHANLHGAALFDIGSTSNVRLIVTGLRHKMDP